MRRSNRLIPETTMRFSICNINRMNFMVDEGEAPRFFAPGFFRLFLGAVEQALHLFYRYRIYQGAVDGLCASLIGTKLPDAWQIRHCSLVLIAAPRAR